MSYMRGIAAMLNSTIHTLKNKWQFDALLPLFYRCLLSIFSVQHPVEGDRNLADECSQKN